jgi:hypothetical protein
MDAASAGMGWGDEEERTDASATEAAALERLTMLLIGAGKATPPRDPARAEAVFQRILAARGGRSRIAPLSAGAVASRPPP